jgi:CRISPR-associated endoribonuclease Cas6
MQQITLAFNSTGRSPIDGRLVTARGLHGLLFDVLQRADQAEASWLHHHNSPKPFSLVPLYRADGGLAGLRLAAVTERTAALFRQAWEQAKQNGDVLRLGRYQTFTVQEINCQQGLSFPELATISPSQHLAFHFLSPTAFKQGPGHLPLPLPANVFSWPFRIWQTFAPNSMTLSDTWLDWCEQEVFVVSHRIETVTVAVSQQEQFTGFVGIVHFRAQQSPDAYLRVWQAMARLATFCGVGHKTTMGMGAVAIVEANGDR